MDRRYDGISDGPRSKSNRLNASLFVFIIDGTIAIDKKAGLFYHGDADLEKFTALIGEKMEWTKPDRK